MPRSDKINLYKIGKKPLSAVENEYGVEQVPPIFGAKMGAKEYFDIVSGNYIENGELLTPSEAGCALSHLSIYEKVVASDRPALILEEDISPGYEDLAQAVAFCEATRLDVVHLGWHPQISYGAYFLGKYEDAHRAFRLDPSRKLYGTFSYFVTPLAARELLSFHSGALKKADYWSLFFYTRDFAPYFRPFFTHPPERGEIETERGRVAQKRKRLTPESLKRAVVSRARAVMRQKLLGYRPLSPAFVEKTLAAHEQ